MVFFSGYWLVAGDCLFPSPKLASDAFGQAGQKFGQTQTNQLKQHPKPTPKPAGYRLGPAGWAVPVGA